MTKGEIIESVVLSVSGGRLSADVDVRREDVAVLVAPAISAALQQYLDNSLDRNRKVLSLTGAPGQHLSGGFTVTYTLTPAKDTTRGLYYIEMPGRLILVANGFGVETVQPTQGRKSYKGVGSQSELSGLGDTGIVFYWHELISGNSRLYFDTLGQPVCDHIVKAVIDPAGYGIDDDIPLPSGVDMAAIEMLVNHFKPETPQDQELNDTDDVRAAN